MQTIVQGTFEELPQPFLDFRFVLLNGALYRTLITEADTIQPATQCGFGSVDPKLSLNQQADGGRMPKRMLNTKVRGAVIGDEVQQLLLLLIRQE